MNDAEYFAYELAKLGPAPHDVRMKITSADGDTRWMSLTGEDLDRIKAILTT